MQIHEKTVLEIGTETTYLARAVNHPRQLSRLNPCLFAAFNVSALCH